MTIDEFVDRAEHCARLQKDIDFNEKMILVLGSKGRWKEVEEYRNEIFVIHRKLTEIHDYVNDNSTIGFKVFVDLTAEFYKEFGKCKEIADRFKKEFGNER